MSRILYRYLRLSVLWLSLVAVAALAPLLKLVPRSGTAGTYRSKISSLRQTVVPDDFQKDDLSSTKTPTTTTIGVIGCGTIASAIVTGLAVSDQVQRITVSRRSEHRSTALQSKFPHLVQVESEDSNNQAVLDASDIVFLTVLPQQTENVMRDLQWDPERHTLVSLVATAPLDDLLTYSQLPASRVFKMICLPAVAYNEGICLLQPAAAVGAANEPQKLLLVQLLETLGGVVVASNDEQMAAMMVPPCLMGSFYGVLRNHRDWLVHHSAGTMSPDQATYVVTRFYYGMMQDAARQCGSSTTVLEGASDALDRLIAEQTPGGLNEQGLANLEHLGTMEAYNQVQDAIWRRITGQSDGSLS